MKDCSCAEPRPFPSPAKTHLCVQCGYRINPEWTSNDKTVAEFFDRLGEGLFAYDQQTGKLLTEPWFEKFRAEAMARERAGRSTFKHRSLNRDNKTDANEEWTDGNNYILFDHLQEVRASGDDSDMDTVLTVAKHAALAYKNTEVLRRKRAGNTGPAMDEA